MADYTDDDKKKKPTEAKNFFNLLQMSDLTSQEAQQAHQQAIADKLREEAGAPSTGGWGGAAAHLLQGVNSYIQQKKADASAKQLSADRKTFLANAARAYGLNPDGTPVAAAPTPAPTPGQFDPNAGYSPSGISPLISGQQPQPAPTQQPPAPYSGQMDPLAMLGLKKKNPYDINPDYGPG